MWTHTVSILREDKGRCWSDTFTSQRWSAHHQELGARHRTGPPSQLRKGTDTVNTLVCPATLVQVRKGRKLDLTSGGLLPSDYKGRREKGKFVEGID